MPRRHESCDLCIFVRVSSAPCEPGAYCSECSLQLSTANSDRQEICVGLGSRRNSFRAVQVKLGPLLSLLCCISRLEWQSFSVSHRKLEIKYSNLSLDQVSLKKLNLG